jgi:hypothetical protein
LTKALGPAYTAEERGSAAEVLAALPGGAAVIDWFGYPTGFHDAELLSIDLGDRSAARLRLHAWRDTGETGPDGYHVLDRHAVVTVALQNLRVIMLRDLHMMPAIVFRLDFERTETGVAVVWDSSYGANGWAEADEARIEVTPGNP